MAEVYPELVAYDNDGHANTVRCQYLAPMLLNELQKQHRPAEAQAEAIRMQQQEIEGLTAQLRLQHAAFQERLSRLESSVGTQTEVDATVQSQNGEE